MPEAHAGMSVTSSLKLVRPLGEGGMGSIWVAHHETLRTDVVVKFISRDLKDSREAVDRFSREAAAASQVKSPHVVQTFDHGVTAEGIPYIVMELLEGRDLGAYLETEGRCSPELTLEIVAQLSRALDRAHDRGIVHRDIKPGNIFLCDGGGGDVFVKLLDFGIAKGMDVPKIDSTTKTGAMIGSPFYMSPEQILGSKDIDQRSDLWSVGVVTFEALTGKKPFDAETMGGLAIKIHSEPLPLPSKLVPELPPSVDAWFVRACARRADERFSSAKEMTEALAQALGGELPRSLDVPRVSTGSRDHTPSAPMLVAGATTEAGVVRPTSPATRRNFVLLIAATAVVLGVTSFAVVSARRHASPAPSGNALVSPPPPPSTAEPPRSNLAANVSAPPVPAPVETAADTGTAVEKTPPPTKKAGGHGSHHAHSPKASTSSTVASPASPPATAAPTTTTRPANTGHDIF